ncbi:acyl-CoA dehydrogenase family protein [Hoeflea olei]|uniref:Acyl-CoA dehydrogenase n=1 Tax=Hoeflea olei TaxID=1480615 RepID=A0A1C1YYN4_9HYPH|nr:acyl-CoA dehydrogenase family protein [Hoeflea olei]OCW58520.1 acyl-CoA dehydrogenase [Hoeflea olei]
MTFQTQTPPSGPSSTEALRAEALRAEVRAFLKEELGSRTPAQRAESWNGFDTGFSRRLGARGWIGMALPARYGGGERTMAERYVVLEELLAAGAPVMAHWIADRQSGALLLRYGNEEQRRTILPKIASGECYFCIGMSEPDAGSDLAAVRCRARKVEGGYLINGTKLWTSNAHRSHYMILFCRTDSADSDNRHGGMSQFLIDMTTPGLSIRPVVSLAGEHHFNEVTFTDVTVSDEALLGREGDGWAQVTSELTLERSGPERFLSSFQTVVELARGLRGAPDAAGTAALGRIAAHLVTLRAMSMGVSRLIDQGEDPAIQAALVKDLGAVLEQEIPDIVRLILGVEARQDDPALAGCLATTILAAPSFSLRGGTREILRGIIARGLGLR